MTETSEDVAFVSIVEDIAALVRRLAKMEPFKSASGPEALLALATRLDGMIANEAADQPGVIRVAVQKKKNR